MSVPFSVEQFLEIFRKYNEAIFPFQIGLYVLALLAVFPAVRKSKWSEFISGILAFLWLWMGLVYHLAFFSKINKAAYLFGTLFIIQGLLFFILGVLKHNLRFRFSLNGQGLTGAFLILLGLIIYPLLNLWNGHSYPYSPTFGLPCPTTIFTLGMLCWLDNKVTIWVWVIPWIWSIIGFTAAILLGFNEDVGLLMAGMVTAILVIKSKRSGKIPIPEPI